MTLLNVRKSFIEKGMQATLYRKKSERADYEYKRGGVADLFMLSLPLAGNCHVDFWDQRQRIEWAEGLRNVTDELYPETNW